MAGEKVTVDLTTGIGTLSFPHLFSSTKSKNDKGEDVYDVQIIIPKSQTKDIRDILAAIKEVGSAKWGANWKKVRTPLRDGDVEADDITEDGKTKGEKYPERLGCYFLNARSSRPVGVFDRTRTPILDADAVYGGCKGKIAVSFYPYSQQGNNGIGCGLNGVQKIADGDAFGSGRPSVESMFDMLDDDDFEDEDVDVDEEYEEEEEETPPPAPKKRAAKKAVAKKKAPEPEPDEDEDDEEDLYEEDDEDEYDDLDEEEEEEAPAPKKRVAKKTAARRTR